MDWRWFTIAGKLLQTQEDIKLAVITPWATGSSQWPMVSLGWDVVGKKIEDVGEVRHQVGEGKHHEGVKSCDL